MTDLFDKTRTFTRAKEAIEMGMYPYFQPLSDSEGTTAVFKGKEVVMIGSNNYLGLTTHPKVRQAAIDGMTNPFFLEIILNPDLLPAERPMVLAHEWAHLAGYAHETEANFVAWLTCLQGDSMSRYSAWLSAYGHASSVLSRDDRRALPPLDEGPLDDLRAMAARHQRSSPVVRNAAREVYDSYLRAHRVSEGVASYGAVVRLMLGSRFDDDWTPRLKSLP